MQHISDVFSTPKRLNLTGTERTIWLQPLLEFLQENPTHIGRVLMGGPGPWKRKHVRELELLICGLDDRQAIRNYLSILHEAARLWSADTRKRVPLPHFLPHETSLDNPFSEDFAAASLCCADWKQRLAMLVSSDRNERDVRLSTFLVSAILNGHALGAPLLVALVRAIPDWRHRTFVIGGRVHIELSLSRRGVFDAEHRIWLPDALTAIQWSKLQIDDAEELLAPVVRNGCPLRPSDAAVLRRVGRLISQFRSREDQGNLPGLDAMRRSTREVALVNRLPVFVAYDWTELASESLRRVDVPRLFPGDNLMEFIEAETPLAHSANLVGTNEVLPQPQWIGELRGAVRSAKAREALEGIVDDVNAPAVLRLVADFGVASRLRTSRPGKPLSARTAANTTLMVGKCLGPVLESEDVAKLSPSDRRTVYVEAINAQPVRRRPDAVQAVLEFDLYLVAKFPGTLPIPRNSVPWFRKAPAFDPNIITHSEYDSILTQLEDEWPVTSSERRRMMAVLIVILAFRCMLRRGELRGLRIEDVLLILEDPLLGDPEVQVRPRKEDPLKTPAAERRIPLQLLSDDELRMVKDWMQARLREKAKANDYFFAIPEEGIQRIPKSFFDRLNKLLRKLTRYAAGGKGMHLHHCRHAGGTWLFVAMWLADAPGRRQLFPKLEGAHAWLEQGNKFRELLCGNGLPSKRLPYVVANVCGQASFDTTASSYINIFPWLVAHDADGTGFDRRDLLRIASGASPKQFRSWLRKEGPHNIAVQVLIGKGLRVKPQNQVQSDTVQASVATSDMNWLTAIWRQIMRRSKGEIESTVAPEMTAMFQRADWLTTQRSRNGSPRHPVERTAGSASSPNASANLAAPLRPRQTVSPLLLRRLRELFAADREFLAEALGLFGRSHERDGFVAFESIDRIEAAERYIRLLGDLDIRNSEIEVICGVTDANSDVLREWRNQLIARGHKGLRIRPCPPGGSYAPRGSLWVRPSADMLTALNTGPSGFRYLMAMAFIAFGEIPKAATVALPPATA
jgi:integrase